MAVAVGSWLLFDFTLKLHRWELNTLETIIVNLSERLILTQSKQMCCFNSTLMQCFPTGAVGRGPLMGLGGL